MPILSVPEKSVLIVDDEKLNVELAGAYLKEEGYRIFFALSGMKALEMVQSEKIDLILLDINMPNLDGFTVCQKLKADSSFADIPVIFLTALNDIDNVTKAFEVGGGVDYIVKPFNPLELKARVKTHLRVLTLMEDLKQKQSRLAQLSISDPFTKLPNALYFESQLKIALQKEPVWVVQLKIDRLDRLNGLYGFSKTNRVLARFAKLLQQSCYTNAKIARLYGGSFGILFGNYSSGEIEKNMITIRKALQADSVLGGGVIKVDAAVMHIKESTSLERIYIKLQQGLDMIEHSLDFNFLFVAYSAPL